eukprot:246705-Chlamydomonas_euryale.AAC.1
MRLLGARSAPAGPYMPRSASAASRALTSASRAPPRCCCCEGGRSPGRADAREKSSVCRRCACPAATCAPVRLAGRTPPSARK